MVASAAACSLRLVYLVHDLNDPAVVRRIEMLRPYLVSAVVIGFFRSAESPTQVAGWHAVGLGRTADGQLGRRALSVLQAQFHRRRLKSHFRGATVVIARQLEMLTLAVALRGRYAQKATLAYECLDIHRLMLTSSVVTSALLALEARLLAKVDLLIVSSPAFIADYFQPVHGARVPRVCLLENKVLNSEHSTVLPNAQREAGPPWRIGLAGMLRCRHSLVLLADLTRQLQGKVVVELHGRPSKSAIPDFDALIDATPAMHFFGPYDRQRGLANVYRAVHFTWAIDFYEADGNSRWLLPNRLYEGGLHGAIPIALASVETGRWLDRNNAGVVLKDPVSETLLHYFTTLQMPDYATEVDRLAAVPREAWIDDGRDGLDLVAALLLRRGEKQCSG